MADMASAASGDVFTRRLNRVHQVCYPPDRSARPSQEQMAAAMSNGDERVSQSYLSKLFKGRAGNPSIRMMVALAGYYQIDERFFTTQDEEVAERLLLLCQLQHKLQQSPEIHHIGLTSEEVATLPAASLRKLLNLVDIVAEKERRRRPAPARAAAASRRAPG